MDFPLRAILGFNVLTFKDYLCSSVCCIYKLHAGFCLVTSVDGNDSFINSGLMSLDLLDIPDVLDPPIILTMKHTNVSRLLINFVVCDISSRRQTNSCLLNVHL